MQAVSNTDGADICQLVLRECNSVGMPSWESHAASELNGSAYLGRVSLYAFGTDQGPDTVGIAGRVRTNLARVLFTMFVWVYCLFRVCHISASHW